MDFLKEDISLWLGLCEILQNCSLFPSPIKTLLTVSRPLLCEWLLIVIPFPPAATGRECEQIYTAVNGIILNPSEEAILLH